MPKVMFDRVLLFLVSFFMLAVGQVQAGSPVTQPLAGGWQRAAQSGNATVFGPLSSSKAKGTRYRADAINVKFRPGVSEAEKSNLHKRHGSTPGRSFDHLRMQHVKLRKGVSVEEALKSYQADPRVEHAEPDYLLNAQASPNDPFFSQLWGFNTINAPIAWDTSTGSSNVVIAVIDTGIDYNHPDLAANIWTNPGINVGYSGDLHGIDTSNHDSDPMDDHYHGTHVAGTIGAVGNNGVGVAGLSWNVKLMACKFLDAAGNGYTADAIECLEYVRMMKAQGVNIVATNNSWGGGDDSLLLRQAIDAQRDILFIAAAGNDSTNNDAAPFYPASFALPNLIAVAATDNNDNVASFSNTGRNSVHVAAPGTSIFSTTPGNSYQYLQGTSMAAPHVTGLAALLGASGKDWKQIRNLILAGGNGLASLTGKTITGRRIDAANSVACLDRPLFALQQMPDSLQAGTTVTLSAISINCGQAAGPVSVTITPQGGAASYLQLRDDGVAPDLAAGDGVFTGSWTPASS
ncbi:MAG TPA: S8 family peptidase, partial [Geomonas sp.]|nr:S8 family peptidase [Geomonas sp.]